MLAHAFKYSASISNDVYGLPSINGSRGKTHKLLAFLYLVY